MTTEEIKNLVSEAKHIDWFNNINETINFSYTNEKFNFTTFTGLYEFVSNQFESWTQTTDIPNDFANHSKTHFQNLKIQLEHFISNYKEQEPNNLNANWKNSVMRNIRTLDTTFTIDSALTQFLINLYHNSPENYNGAYQFVTKQSINNNRDYFEGAILAYEFKHSDNSIILKRANLESKSIEKLKAEFQSYIDKTEEHLTKILNERTQKLKENINGAEEYKTKKETEINDWQNHTHSTFDEFYDKSKTKISDLEKTYEELLRLKKPAEYWNKRATALNKEGNKFRNFLIGLIAIGGLSLYLLLWKTPDDMLKDVFGNDKYAAIRWSIVFIVFMSLIFLGIRYIAKAMFSSYHLARDAEEREQLMYVYLAMIKDEAVDEKDKHLIMQSLFSRADTGLLKEDSSPTMPNGMEKIIK